jgi:hypothetical protein|tara:strand:+ start:3595 stop:3711 length:117 start_codon:yes stop_codon:yes gene_type:complete
MIHLFLKKESGKEDFYRMESLKKGTKKNTSILVKNGGV